MDNSNNGIVELKIKYERLRNKFPNKLTAYALQAILMWQETMTYEVFLEENIFIAFSIFDKFAFYPMGEETSKKEVIKLMMNNWPEFSLRYLRDEDAVELKSWFGAEFEIYEDEDGSEYIYLTEELSNVHGTKNRHYRREINNVLKNCKPKISSIGEDDKGNLELFMDKWRQAYCAEDDFKDFKAALYAIENFEDLGYQGIMAIEEENNNLLGFIMGYENTKDTFTFCVVKQVKEIEGMVHYLINEFSKMMLNKYMYVNLEEDLGIKGIRNLKRGLNPTEINKVWRADFVDRK